MSEAYLEHANITVRDAKATAQLLVDLFGWRIRWEGDSIYDGYSVHVGGENSYIALYNPPSESGKPVDSFHHINGLNHLGIVVDDLDTKEKDILAAGYKTGSHADYEPGRRFYFFIHDELEIEVISYQ